MNSNIIITSDSTTDLSKELLERYDIKVLPLKISLGEKDYTDGIDINPDFIYDHYAKTGELPKTSAPNVDTFINFFGQYADGNTSVIHFSLSSEMSSTYNNACIAAGEFENVYIVDTKNLSTGGGLLVVSAAEMVKKGMDAQSIYDECNRLVPCVDASFVLDSLEFIYKGGRCSAVSMLGANLLKLKPCIEVKNGVMGVGKKYRGRYSDVIKQYAADRLADTDNIMPDRIFVTHSGCDMQLVNEVADIVKKTLPFKEVFITRAGCTISSHCGDNTLGVLFIRKSPI